LLTVTRSKKRFEWVVEIDSTPHTIVLFYSSMSGKRRVIVDGKERVYSLK